MNTSPLGLFVTWTVYGTFLPGDARGWKHRTDGNRLPQPLLENWQTQRLKHRVVMLSDAMQRVAESAVREIVNVRSWSLWAIAVRTNHVHVVVTAPGYDPKIVRDQLKAKATMELRRTFSVWRDRPVWTEKGEIAYLNRDDQIQKCVVYVNDAQDRKHRDP